MKALSAVPEAAIRDMLAWPHSGFSLNAPVRIEAHEREALGRLLRYVLRPALSLAKLSYDGAIVRYRPDKKGLPPLPFGCEAEGSQLEGFEDEGRQSWPSGSGADWPA